MVSLLFLFRNVLVKPTLSQASLYGMRHGKQIPSCHNTSWPSARLYSHAPKNGHATQPQQPAKSLA